MGLSDALAARKEQVAQHRSYGQSDYERGEERDDVREA